MQMANHGKEIINNIREVLFQKSHEYYIDFVAAILGVRLHLSFCNPEKSHLQLLQPKTEPTRKHQACQC